MKIITEEMRFRKRLCEFALKNGVTKAARMYHTNRQFVYRQLEKYEGTLRSLELKSRKPHSHPNTHTEEKIRSIEAKKMLIDSCKSQIENADECAVIDIGSCTNLIIYIIQELYKGGYQKEYI